MWVRDANVPYRLMHRDTLAGLVDGIPKDFYMANILVSALHEHNFGIHWINIHFRDRLGGSPSVKGSTFMKQASSSSSSSRP